MASETQDLTVKITADVGSAQAGADAVMASIEKLQATIEKQAEAGKAAAETAVAGHEAAEAATEKHEKAEEGLAAAMERTATITRNAATTMETFGLKTGEATERVLGLAEGLGALEATAGPMLLIGAALIAIGAAANMAAEGIGDAAKEQMEFLQIGQAVKNQGGDWDEARESIELFTETMSKATIFSNGELLEAMRALKAAGIDVHDSEILVATAGDVSAGSGRGLMEVVNDLIGAENKRFRGLETLDLKLRDTVKTSHDMQSIVDQLNHDFAGDGEAAVNTYAGAQAQLRNEIEFLGTEMGTALLPMLENITSAFVTGIRVIEDYVSAALHLASTMGHVRDLMFGGGDKHKQYDAAVSSAKKSYDAFADAGYALEDPGKYARDLRALEKKTGTTLDNDVQLGNGKGAGAHADQAPLNTETLATAGLKDRQKELEQSIKALTESEVAYKDRVSLSTTELQKEAAQLALNNKIVEDAKAAISVLSNAISGETAERDKDQAKLSSQAAALEAVALKHDALLAATNKGTTASKEQRVELENLSKAHEEQKKKVDDLQRAVDTLNGQISTNTDLLHKQQQAMIDVAKPIAEATLAYNDQLEKLKQLNAMHVATFGNTQQQDIEIYTKALAKLDASKPAGVTINNATNVATSDGSDNPAINKFLSDRIALVNLLYAATSKLYDVGADAQKKMGDDQQQLAEESATYGMSIQQREAYYKNLHDKEVQDHGQETEESVRYYGEYFKAEQDALKQREELHDAFVAKWTSLESTLLDDVLSKHKSLRDALKDVWKDLLGDWTSTLENMVLKSSVLGELNSSLFGAVKGGGPGTTDTAGGGLFGVFTSLISSTGGQQGLTVGLNDDTIQKQTGSAAGVGGGGGGGSAGSASGVLGKADGGSASPTAFSGALGGAGIGEIGASITGGSSQYGALGGAFGGLLAVGLHANPLIGAGIDLASGLIGSLFGNHETAAETPDVSDPTFHQNEDNWNGEGGLVQSKYSTGQGGTSLSSSIEAWANSEQGKTGLSTAMQDAVNQVLSLEKGNPNADLSTKSLHQGVLTLADGSTIDYSNLKSVIDTFDSNGGTSSSSIPTFSVSHSYGDANLTNLTSTGSLTPTTINAIAGATSAAGGVAAQAPITVTINGNVVGPGGLDSVAGEIAIALGRRNSGMTPGGAVFGGSGILRRNGGGGNGP